MTDSTEPIPSDLLLHTRDARGVHRLTLNHPASFNTLSEAMLAALQRAIRWGEGDTLYDLFDRARRMRREVIEAGQDTSTPNWGREN